MNLEYAITPEMLDIACRVRPHDVCLVPERREELTTEGGLDVIKEFEAVSAAVSRLHDAGIRVSIFIDPDEDQIKTAAKAGARVIELHTGRCAQTSDSAIQQEELGRIRQGMTAGIALGMRVNAGHGLHYHNVKPVAA